MPKKYSILSFKNFIIVAITILLISSFLKFLQNRPNHSKTEEKFSIKPSGEFESINNLILNRKVPKEQKEFAYRNLLGHVQNIPNASFKPIDVNAPPIREGRPLKYNPMNPSIQKTDNGYKIICRMTNYIQTSGKNYRSFDYDDPKGTYRTKNIFAEYDISFKKIAQYEVVEELARERIWHNVEGLEDCRLFEKNKSNWFTCVTLDTSYTGKYAVSLCKLNDQPHDNKIAVESLLPLISPDPQRPEKNWLPFVKDDEIFIIYSFDPFILYKPNLVTGACETVLQYEPSHDFSKFRGSAAPIVYEDGYLTLTHELIFPDQRYYVHRLVYLDKNFIVQKISIPFTFRHLGVEFCCGMTIDHEKKNLLLPIGIEDREIALCIVDLNIINSLLKPLPK
ncbi:MAG: hypothetical protein H0W88_04040 [Parachlamydiaceae bacterium]|nr:hypothetical protein [Parachlamydiaceae bacterium]